MLSSLLNRRTATRLLLAAAGATLALPVLAGWAQDTNLKTLKGSIRADGSSTVYPLAEAVAEEFSKEAPGVRVNVGISGTGGGFKRFIVGEIDISNASRPIKKSEMDTAAKNKIEFIEIPVAFDGLSIVVNPKNTWVKTLTVDQLKKIYSAAGTAKTWKDVDPSWPDKAIKVYSPGTDSGTFDYFREVTVGKDGKIRSDMSVSEDDNTLVTGVEGDQYAIGYFGCAYYFENKDRLKVVPIVPPSGGAAVEPTPQTITDGSYAPFSRPLFIYVNAKSLAEKPEVGAFARYFIANAPKYADEVGYVHLPKEIYERAAKNLASKKLGTQMSDEKGDTKHGQLVTIYN